MLNKIIINDSFNFNDAIASIVPLFKSAVDKGWMHKRAASPLFDFSKYAANKDETLVHLLALGDGEFHGCFPEGTEIRLGTAETKDIKDIAVGDEVVTHTGKVKKVTTKFQRPYTGQLISLNVCGMLDKIRATPNHKFWVIRREQIACDIDALALCKPNTIQRTNVCCKHRCHKTALTLTPEWVAAEDLKEDDCVLQVIPGYADVFQDNSRVFFWNGYLCRPIDNIDVEQFTGDVFNFEVEDEHSYTVSNGIAVKNCNRNGDYFPKAANEKYHHTFLNGHYFHNHQNKDPKQAKGRVVASVYNPDMHRVELIVGLDNNKCAEELSQLEKNGTYSVSMACTVPFDTCCICNNRAKTRRDYCGHALEKMGKILENGQQVYVINDDPTYFDISRVHKGADRVAFTFRPLSKAASFFEPRVIGGAELAEIMGVVNIGCLDRKELWNSIKESRAKWNSLGLEKVASSWPCGEMSDSEFNALKSVGDPGKQMYILHQEGICLSPSAFARMLGPDSPMTAISPDATRQVLNTVSKDASLLESVWSNRAYDGQPFTVAVIQTPIVKHALASLRSKFGVVDGDVNNSYMAADEPMAKQASAVDAGFAAQYAAYVLSFADYQQKHASKRQSDYVRNLTSLCLFP